MIICAYIKGYLGNIYGVHTGLVGPLVLLRRHCRARAGRRKRLRNQHTDHETQYKTIM